MQSHGTLLECSGICACNRHCGEDDDDDAEAEITDGAAGGTKSVPILLALLTSPRHSAVRLLMFMLGNLVESLAEISLMIPQAQTCHRSVNDGLSMIWFFLLHTCRCGPTATCANRSTDNRAYLHRSGKSQASVYACCCWGGGGEIQRAQTDRHNNATTMSNVHCFLGTDTCGHTRTCPVFDSKPTQRRPALID